jgi:flagellar motor switch protein FliN/FliY
MSEILSQDEIDALLSGGMLQKSEQNTVSDEEIELVKEMAQMGMNVFANYMINSLGQNTVVGLKDAKPLSQSDTLQPKDYFIVEVVLDNAVSGKKLFLFKPSDVISINDMSIGGSGISEEKETSELHASVMMAHMNEVMPLIIKTISGQIKAEVEVKSVKQFPNDSASLENYLNESKAVRIDYSIQIGDAINSEVIELVPLNMVTGIKNLLLSNGANLAAAENAAVVLTSNSAENKAAPKPISSKQAVPEKQPVAIRPVEFPVFGNGAAIEPTNESIEFIMDVPLQVSVELGRCKKSIKDILDLNIGTIIELNKLAEDYVDIFVNNKLIGRGEVVVVDENFGIRIMELYTTGNNKITGKV